MFTQFFQLMALAIFCFAGFLYALWTYVPYIYVPIVEETEPLGRVVLAKQDTVQPKSLGGWRTCGLGWTRRALKELVCRNLLPSIPLSETYLPQPMVIFIRSSDHRLWSVRRKVSQSTILAYSTDSRRQAVYACCSNTLLLTGMQAVFNRALFFNPSQQCWCRYDCSWIIHQ